MGLLQENVVAIPGPVMLGGGDLLLQMSSMVVSGQMRNNEVLMPANEYSDGLMSLQWGGDYALLGNTRDHTSAARVLVSAYWAHYAVEANSSNLVPANGDARIACAAFRRRAVSRC
jgi:hypothetical protein